MIVPPSSGATVVPYRPWNASPTAAVTSMQAKEASAAPAVPGHGRASTRAWSCKGQADDPKHDHDADDRERNPLSAAPTGCDDVLWWMHDQALVCRHHDALRLGSATHPV